MGKLGDKATGEEMSYQILASAGYICVPDAAYIAAVLAGTKNLSKLAGSDLQKLAKFAEGTFSPSGDAAETTVLKHSDGSSYFTIVTEGTLAYDGEIPNFSEAAIKYLFGANYKSIAVSASGKATVDGGTAETNGTFGGSIFAGSKLGVISGFAKVENIPLFIETTQGDYDFMLFPNATVTATQAGSLDSDGTATWALNITANAYSAKSGENADLNGASVIYGTFNTKPIESITVGSASPSVAVGATSMLAFTVTPNDAINDIVWMSADEEKVSVRNGVITGVAVTTTAIKVTATSAYNNAVKGEWNVSVTASQS